MVRYSLFAGFFVGQTLMEKGFLVIDVGIVFVSRFLLQFLDVVTQFLLLAVMPVHSIPH
jgi:hypothetical protein